MNNMENTQNDYDALRRLHDTTNISVDELQKENENLRAEIALRDAKLINCQKALDINKEIMRNALTGNNEMKDAYAIEIQELKAKIKELTK